MNTVLDSMIGDKVKDAIAESFRIRYDKVDNLVERYKKAVVVGVAEQYCWGWSGYLPSNRIQSYCKLSVYMGKQTRPIYMHRLSFVLETGIVLHKEQFICHSCDNPTCTNPLHLFLGSHADNVHDMWGKGRGSKPPVAVGLNNFKATLTDEQVLDIRARMQAGQAQRDVAKLYGVSSSTAWRIGKSLTRATSSPTK